VSENEVLYFFKIYVSTFHSTDNRKKQNRDRARMARKAPIEGSKKMFQTKRCVSSLIAGILISFQPKGQD
jgi:hypothetical protein